LNRGLRARADHAQAALTKTPAGRRLGLFWE
jgi:hypothetical protein